MQTIVTNQSKKNRDMDTTQYTLDIEGARLQTIPDWYKFGCSDTQAYKMLGNGWPVEVVKHILSHIIK